MENMAFAAAAPVTGFFGGAAEQTVCASSAAPAAASGVAGLDMRCRRDLKHEKRCRNAVFARAHRQRPVRTNRRAAASQKENDDNEYLSNIYSTLPFGKESGGDREQTGKGGRK